MAKRTISSALLILAIAIAAVASTARPGVAQRAEDECLSKPNGAPTAGMHWWYRTDRANNRRCWYLGPQREQPAQAGQNAATPAQAGQDTAKPRRVAKPVVRPANEPSDTPLDEPSKSAAGPMETPQAGPAPWSEQPASVAASAPTLLVPVSPTSLASAQAGLEQPTDDQPTNTQPTMTEGDEMPLIWPVLTEAELAASDVSQARSASLLVVIVGVLGLAAVLGYWLFKLFAAGRLRHHGVALNDQPSDPARPAGTPDRVAPAFAGAVVSARPAAASAGRVAPAMPTLRRSPSIVAKADSDDLEAELQWLRQEWRRQVA